MENVHGLEWLNEAPLEDLNRRKLARLSRGDPIVDLSMINPDLEPPPLALDKLTEAVIKPEHHRYAVSRGIRRLRSAFSAKYASAFGVVLDPDEEICVSLGTKDAVLLALTCLCSRRHRVLVGTPCYPMYRSACRLAGVDPVFFSLDSDENLMLRSIEKHLADEPADMLLLNFPNNPTGISVSAGFFRNLAPILSRYDCLALNDFVYGEMHFESGRAVSMLSEPALRPRAFETYSLSKAYSVPGWRIGALSGVQSSIGMISRLKSYVDYGAFLPLQMAAAALLNSSKDLVEPARIQYRSRAATLSQGLRRLGWEIQIPHAGACVWARMPEGLRRHGSLAAARLLLETRGLAVMPGALFGEEYNEFLRFALVSPSERIQEVLLRLDSLAYDQAGDFL